jgi:hypothetical protein
MTNKGWIKNITHVPVECNKNINYTKIVVNSSNSQHKWEREREREREAKATGKQRRKGNALSTAFNNTTVSEGMRERESRQKKK